MQKGKAKKYLAETKRTWQEKLKRHKAKKPFAITFEQLSEQEKEILRKWSLKPLEQVTETELKRCTRSELHAYCAVYGIPRKRSDIVIEELIQRKDFISLAKKMEQDQQEDQYVAPPSVEETTDWRQVAYHSPFEFFLHSSKKKKLGTQTCSDLSGILYLAFELVQTGRAKVACCLLPLLLRRTKTSAKKQGFNREITILGSTALPQERSDELIRLLSRLFEGRDIEWTLSLHDMGEVPNSMGVYNERSLLELEQGKVAALNQLIFRRWCLRDYLSAIDDITSHIQQFPYAKYPVFYILLGAFFCLQAYKELGFDKELTAGTDFQKDLSSTKWLGYVFPFNFLSIWSYLADLVNNTTEEKNFNVEYFEKALKFVERCTEYNNAPNILVILKSIIFAHCRNMKEAVTCMEEFIREQGSYDSYLLENYLLCLEVYETVLSSSDAGETESVRSKRVVTAQRLLLEVNPFSSIAFASLSTGLERSLITFLEIVLAVAHHLDYLGNMDSFFLFHFDFWKNSFRHAWIRFFELLNLCEDEEVVSVWKERRRDLWWPTRFFSYCSLKEDYEHYPEVISYKTFCVRRLIGVSSEYEFFQQRNSDS